MKILAIGGSSSSTSINQQLANHVACQIDGADVTCYELKSLSLPIFSEDEEKQSGHPADARKFIDAIRGHDAIVISLAEHNGSYAAAFKNLYDWASRIEQKVWQDKPMLLLSTSPGPRGGATVLAAAEATFPRMGARLTATCSIPSFYDNFSAEGIKDPAIGTALDQAVTTFANAIS